MKTVDTAILYEIKVKCKEIDLVSNFMTRVSIWLLVSANEPVSERVPWFQVFLICTDQLRVHLTAHTCNPFEERNSL